MYYSLFHAVSSVMVMMPHFNYDKLQRISHKNCLVWSESELSNRGLLPKDIKNLYNKLITAREAFSYNIPLGCLRDEDLAHQFSLKDNFAGFQVILPAILQLANVLSNALYQLAPRQFSGLDDHEKYLENQVEADRIFFQVIEVIDRLGTLNEVDRDDYHRFGWLITKVKMPVPQDWLLSEKILEDLEASWWPLRNKNDFDVREVSQTLSDWLEE
jgi:hypothetical protein